MMYLAPIYPAKRAEKYIWVDTYCWKHELHHHHFFFFVILLQMSAYPVILSLENHCSGEQQEIMAHYLICILGQKLLRVPLNHPTSGDLPSPNVRLRKGRAWLREMSLYVVNQGQNLFQLLVQAKGWKCQYV